MTSLTEPLDDAIVRLVHGQDAGPDTTIWAWGRWDTLDEWAWLQTDGPR